MKKNILFVLVSIGLLVNATAQKLSKKETKSLKRIQSHVNYLASDRLEGRGTGSAGVVAGSANTGGGGGGGGNAADIYTGANGGSGIVIIKWS